MWDTIFSHTWGTTFTTGDTSDQTVGSASINVLTNNIRKNLFSVQND